MTKPHLDLPSILESFDGRVRLFPLPSLVMLPDTFVPLNIFEERYLAMVKDALPESGLIATALLKPGYEADYNDSPPIYPTVCIGKILRPRLKPNGHIELFLYGIARARIVEEIPSAPYRQAQVEILEDVVPPGNLETVAQRLQRANTLIPGRQYMFWGLRRTAEQLRGVDATPGRYADAMASVSGLGAPALYELLEETDVLRRFDLLINHLETQAAEGAPEAPDVMDPNLN